MSAPFSDYSKSKTISHHKFYPYHSQAKPVETWNHGYDNKNANCKQQVGDRCKSGSPAISVFRTTETPP